MTLPHGWGCDECGWGSVEREAVTRHRLETTGDPSGLLPTQHLLFFQVTAPRVGVHPPHPANKTGCKHTDKQDALKAPSQVLSLLCS